jgi:hypothetical protein
LQPKVLFSSSRSFDAPSKYRLRIITPSNFKYYEFETLGLPKLKQDP